MAIQFFSFKVGDKNRLFLPNAYRRSVAWMPQLGDIFPDFQAETTEGPIRFFDWAPGHWTYMFSHPAALTPVCTTELLALSSAMPDFAAKNVKLLGFSGSSREDQEAWHDDIARLFGVTVECPFVLDTTNRMARNFGMIHDKQSSDRPIRKSFIIDPEMRIRMIFEYPLSIARGTDEILRVIDALQIADSTGLEVPADWVPGDDLLYAEDSADAAMRDHFGKDFVRLTSYLAVVRASFFESGGKALGGETSLPATSCDTGMSG
jgi:peroxiredoxin (alkyl hydroperoxide reductase subunit C)